MKVKIAIISPSTNILALTNKVAQKIDNIEIYTVNSSFEAAGVAAKQLVEKEKVEVVLARGRTAQNIRKTVDIPVVDMNISLIDLLEVLMSVNDKKSKIGIVRHLVSFSGFEKFVDTAKALLGMDVEIFDYEDDGDVPRVLEDISNNKSISTILGGAYVIDIAQKKGLLGIEIIVSETSLMDTLNHARQIALVKQKEEKESKRLKAILELTNEGIIALDGRENIVNLNLRASKILKVSPSQATGKPLRSFMPKMNLIISKHQHVENEIVELFPDQQVVVNFRPLKVRDEYFGSLVILENISNIQNIEQKIRKKLSAKGLVAKKTLNDIVGSSSAIEQCKQKAEKFSKTKFNILLSGESGTGKEMFAQAIHLLSDRKNGAFVAVNCAALPETLLESELFGYEEGAFSGAKKGGKQGLFELAHGGTIFLDEISSVHLAIQARLLRVIQEKEIMRVGGDKVIPVDVRVISATNEPLAKKVQEGTFRTDLFFRINELVLSIPPLRYRSSDIPILVNHLLVQLLSNTDSADLEIIANKFIDILEKHLKNYSWPGNVRELENFVKRMVTLYDEINNQEIVPHDIIKETFAYSEPSSFEPIQDDNALTIPLDTWELMENYLIKQAFEKLNSRKVEAAKALGISRSTLWRKLNKAERN